METTEAKKKGKAMQPSYRLELSDRKNRLGEYPIFLRITIGGKRAKKKTDVVIYRKSDWNSTPKGDNWVRASEPNATKLNKRLAEILAEAKGKYEELGEKGVATSEKVATELNRHAERNNFSFIGFANGFAKRTLEAGDYRTYTKYITFLNKLLLCLNGVSPDVVAKMPHSGKKLEDFMGNLKKKELLFGEITLSFLNKFKAYLKKLPNAKHPELNLHQNTISKQFDIFKSLYHKGLVELRDEGLSVAENPFDNFVCETIDTSKEKLTWDEIEALKALDLEKGSLLWHTRNCFLLAFYCAGMRAGDLIQLRGTNVVHVDGGWRISYRMDKTATAKDILLLPEALDIIKEYVDLRNRTSAYIFPLLNNHAPYAKATTWEAKEQLPYEVKKMLLQQVNGKNSLLNKYLGKLAAMAGIEKKVSMHVARHSFANIARQKQANVYDISKALGHSSLKITEGYLAKFDTASQDATMRRVFQHDTQADESNLLAQLQSLSPERLASLLAQVNR